MSTRPHTTADPEPRPTAETAESFTVSNAPRTFDPFNTSDCPAHFGDRWADTSDRPSRH
jgi:hypothetical protein